MASTQTEKEKEGKERKKKSKLALNPTDHDARVLQRERGHQNKLNDTIKAQLITSKSTARAT